MALPAQLQTFVDGPKLPKVVLGVVGLVAILGAGYFLLISPVQARIAELVQRRSQVTAEVTQARAQVAEIERFRREIVELEKRLALLRDRLPSDKETPTLYRAVNPYVQILKPISPLDWMPLFLYTIKDSGWAAVLVIFMSSLWPTLANTAFGVASTQLSPSAAPASRSVKSVVMSSLPARSAAGVEEIAWSMRFTVTWFRSGSWIQSFDPSPTRSCLCGFS